MSTFWKSRYALRTLGIKSSTIRELLKVTQRPEVISFGGGLPAPDVFPVERFEEACHKVLQEHGAESLQYGATEGYQPLREMNGYWLSMISGDKASSAMISPSTVSVGSAK